MEIEQVAQVFSLWVFKIGDMFLKEFLKEVEESFKFLEADGFKLRNVDPSENRFIGFEKQFDAGALRIMFQWTQYGEKFYVEEIRAEKRFDIVEEELQKVLSCDLNDLYTIYVAPSLKSVPVELECIQTTFGGFQLTILSKEDLVLFTSFMKEFYLNSVQEFFDAFQNLSSVNEQLQSLLERKEIQTLLTSAGNSTILRLYLIAVFYSNEFVLDYFNNFYFTYLKDNISKSTVKITSERFEILKRNIGQS